MYVFIGDFSTNFCHNLFYFFKGCFAPLCVPLGLKKPGDFTVSEGHGHPLVDVKNKYDRMSVGEIKILSDCCCHCNSWFWIIEHVNKDLGTNK